MSIQGERRIRNFSAGRPTGVTIREVTFFRPRTSLHATGTGFGTLITHVWGGDRGSILNFRPLPLYDRSRSSPYGGNLS